MKKKFLTHIVETAEGLLRVREMSRSRMSKSPQNFSLAPHYTSSNGMRCYGYFKVPLGSLSITFTSSCNASAKELRNSPPNVPSSVSLTKLSLAFFVCLRHTYYFFAYRPNVFFHREKAYSIFETFDRNTHFTLLPASFNPGI